eukprot:5874371-Prymnesium_polylepis.1
MAGSRPTPLSSAVAGPSSSSSNVDKRMDIVLRAPSLTATCLVMPYKWPMADVVAKGGIGRLR